MRFFHSLKNFVSALAAQISACAVWDQPARGLDEANRSAYLDDVFYAAMLGPHI